VLSAALRSLEGGLVCLTCWLSDITGICTDDWGSGGAGGISYCRVDLWAEPIGQEGDEETEGWEEGEGKGERGGGRVNGNEEGIGKSFNEDLGVDSVPLEDFVLRSPDGERSEGLFLSVPFIFGVISIVFLELCWFMFLSSFAVFFFSVL